MHKRSIAILTVLLLLLLCGCVRNGPPAATAAPAASSPGPADADPAGENGQTPAAPRLTVSGLPEPGEALARVPLTVSLKNEGGDLAGLQLLLVWRFYDAEGEDLALDRFPEEQADALLSLAEAPAYYGPVVQRNTAVMELPVRALPAGETAELRLPLPGEAAQTVRADLFIRAWEGDAPRELSAAWWQYSAPDAVLPDWEAEPALPALRTAQSLSWELRDGTAVLTGIGAWPLSCLYIPETVRLSEVPAQTVTVQGARVRESSLFSGLGKEYWLERPDGSRITDRETLAAGNETVGRLLVFSGKYFSKHILRGTEFPEITLTTEDGVELTPANVRDLVTAENCSEQQPLVLLLAPRAGTALMEDPVAGQAYPVLVRGSAFAGCGSLRSVRFASGCRVENGEMKLINTGMFSGCTALESVLGFPESVTSMDFAFLGCTALTQLGELPAGVLSLRDTFSGCTSLRAVPPLPAACTLERCFDGCTALDTPPVLSAGTEDLTECFRGCVSLTEPPLLPDTVVTMARTFYGCTALVHAPVLPENVRDLTRCFLNCSALSGELTIPSRALTPASLHELYFDFSGCTGLEAVHLQYCGFRTWPKSLPGGVPVTADCTHVEDALCPYCHYANLETEIDGLPVVFDAVYEPYYLAAIAFLDSAVPEYLKDSCTQLIFTEDMDRHYYSAGGDLDVKEVAGFFTPADGHACVRTYPYDEPGYTGGYVEHTIIHELAHGYDFKPGDASRRSMSAEWLQLFDQEGRTTANYYGPAYQTYSRSQQITESYAIAVECCYFIPNEFSQVCPGMYAYLQETLPTE